MKRKMKSKKFTKIELEKTRQAKYKARRSLKGKMTKDKRSYVIDTSAVINKSMSEMISKGLTGKIIIPNAVMAELENLANKGNEAGFIGLEEITKLHKLKNKNKILIYFEGIRPMSNHIKYAKSGEIDALIREIARKNSATLITSDLVQAKSAQAYNLEVLFIKPKFKETEKKSWLSFLKK